MISVLQNIALVLFVLGGAKALAGLVMDLFTTPRGDAYIEEKL